MVDSLVARIGLCPCVCPPAGGFIPVVVAEVGDGELCFLPWVVVW